MRLFVALEIPDAVRRELRALREGIEAELPPARWTRPEGRHLTLVFLGDTEEALLAPLEASLEPAFAAAAPIPLRVAGAGTFPPGRPARVAWAGVEAGPELGALQERVSRAATAAVGSEPERRRFHPHVTLARPRKPWPAAAVERFLAAGSRPFGETFTAGEGALIESRLSPGGARYRTVRSFPMEARG